MASEKRNVKKRNESESGKSCKYGKREKKTEKRRLYRIELYDKLDGGYNV